MLTALIGPVSNLLGKFIEDKDMKNKLAHEVATMAENHAQELAKGQIDINKAEATHRSIFVSGWRPFSWLDMRYCPMLALCTCACYYVCLFLFSSRNTRASNF
jgi:hypothetical protein